jgi:hypothetical protein
MLFEPEILKALANLAPGVTAARAPALEASSAGECRRRIRATSWRRLLAAVQAREHDHLLGKENDRSRQWARRQSSTVSRSRAAKYAAFGSVCCNSGDSMRSLMNCISTNRWRESSHAGRSLRPSTVAPCDARRFVSERDLRLDDRMQCGVHLCVRETNTSLADSHVQGQCFLARQARATLRGRVLQEDSNAWVSLGWDRLDKDCCYFEITANEVFVYSAAPKRSVSFLADSNF